MNLVRLIEFFRNHLKNVVRVCLVALAALVIADQLFVNKEPAHTPAEHIFGFWSVFGFVACVAIILVSKWFGHAGIMKRENYYDTPEETPAPSNHGSHAPHH